MSGANASDDGRDADPIFVVGVGASAGGLEALKELFTNVPTDTGMSFVIVQHSEARHNTMLPDILRPVSNVGVELVENGSKALRNRLYVAPSDQDLIFENDVFRLIPRTLTQGIHQPIDTMFCSLAGAFGRRAIGVVLSGTGSDGTVGLKDIKLNGGFTFAQDAQSAKYSGMPKSAVSAGHTDLVLAPSAIAKELSRMASLGSDRSALTGYEKNREATKEIFRILKEGFGVDFSHYKESTIGRRINKRLASIKINSLADYVELLKAREDEVEALYRDVLINVTSFFRDPEMFSALETLVLPQIVANRKPEEAIRVWVPGCSTGEEVYSLAILLAEFNAKHGHAHAIQFFGTDISEAVLEKARMGIYPPAISTFLSPERLKKFFDADRRGYQVKKNIRDTCVFARQNVIADPPLSRIDLISCRNLLIYFGPALQERVVPIFHYALKSPNGFLVLGKSEQVDVFSDFFVPIDKAHKFYRKKDVPSRETPQLFPVVKAPTKLGQLKLGVSSQSFRDSEADVQRETDRFILTYFTPTGVVITDNADIIQFRGRTGPFLDPAGRASFSIYKMLHPDLLQPVRQAIEKAKASETREVRCHRLRYKVGDELKLVDVRVMPLRTPALKQRYFLIVFEEPRTLGQSPQLPKEPNKGSAQAESLPINEADEVRRLLDELDATRQHLQLVIDDRDIGFEELQSANEEVTSSNEELQTMNQELETAKEELESTNEELTTLNEQLRQNMESLRRSEERFRLLVSGVRDYAIFMLDPTGHVLSWNEGAQRIKGYTADEIIGQHFSKFYPKDDAHRTAEELQLAASKGTYQEESWRVRKDGTKFWANVLITAIHDESGHLLGFAKVTRDLTERRKFEDALRSSEARNRLFIEKAPDAFIAMSRGGLVSDWNPRAEAIFGWTRTEIIGQPLRDTIVPVLYREPFAVGYKKFLETGDGPFLNKRIELTALHRDGHEFPVELAVVPLPFGAEFEFISFIQDITERKRAALALEQSQAQVRSLAKFPDERPAPVIRISPDGELLYSNRASKPILDVWGMRVPDEAIELVHLVYRSNETRELELKGSDSQTYALWFVPIAGEGYINVYGTDVTRRKVVEAELRKTNEELERRVQERTHELEKKAEELIKKNLELEQFAGVAAHDLRAPVKSMQSWVDMLDSLITQERNEDIDQAIGFIRSNSKKADQLIADLLEVARATSGPRKFENVDLNACLKNVQSILRENIQRLNARIFVEPLPTVKGVPTQLEALFSNFVRNALTYRRNDVPVEISIACVREADCYKFSVTDNGIGIAHEHTTRIFEMFKRLHSDSEYPGTGIGLAFCKKVVESYGGRLWVESKLGVGSSFFFTFPINSGVGDMI